MTTRSPNSPWYRPAEGRTKKIIKEAASQSAYVVCVHAKPRASKNKIIGLTSTGDALEIAIAAPPIEGAANEALVGFLAELLDIKRSAVELYKGGQSRYKQFIIRNVTEEQIRKLANLNRLS